MPWYLYLALKQLFPSGKWFPFFTTISVLGVSLGVALLVIVTSVMGGFGSEIRRMIVETEGEVQVRSAQLIENASALVRRLEKVPGVKAATPFASGVVLIRHRNLPAYPVMRGLDLNTVERVVQLDHYIRLGSLEALDDDSVILSVQLARDIGATVGDTIDVFSPLILETLGTEDERLLPRSVKVVGLLEIGHQQLDSNTLYCTLRLAQDLYGLRSAVHGINVRAEDGLNEDELARRINASGLPPGLQARSWMDSFDEFLWVLNLEKGMIFFLVLFIVIVAAFSVMSSLLISVVRKTREIGLLGALGARSGQVAACFCAQGLFIGVLGALAGLGLGWVALVFRNDLVQVLARLTQREDALRRFYQFSELPAHTQTGDVVMIVVLTLFISFLAGLLPAWRASRLRPVEAFRNE